MADLAGQMVLVTGGGRGIGRAIARRLARDGATVVVTARNSNELAATCAAIESEGGRTWWFAADISRESEVASLFEAIEESNGQLDVLVNNAGLGLYGPLAEFDAESFDRVMNVNLRGVFLCARRAMRMMMPRKQGAIVNISSVVGIKGYENQSAYGAAKHGVMGLTKALAVEAQPYGIRVSAILPGGVDTAMVRQARPDLDPAELLHPDDVAQAVDYLLSLSDRACVDQIQLRRRGSRPF